MEVMKLDVKKLVIALALPQLAGGLGAVFTASAIPAWYAYLAKPALNPPSWVFGPVWTVLYLLMGIALYLVWRKGTENRESRQALAAFGVQLVLNAVWSPVFFGLQAPGVALAIIVLMWLAIVMTIVRFRKIVPATLWLLLPYLAWVSFATYLNYGIFTLN